MLSVARRGQWVGMGWGREDMGLAESHQRSPRKGQVVQGRRSLSVKVTAMWGVEGEDMGPLHTVSITSCIPKLF